MDANGARALGMSFLAEVLEDPDALARGLEDASDWLEPDFPLHFKNLTAEFTLSLRKPLEPAQEAFLYGPEEVNGDEV